MRAQRGLLCRSLFLCPFTKKLKYTVDKTSTQNILRLQKNCVKKLLLNQPKDINLDF